MALANLTLGGLLLARAAAADERPSDGGGHSLSAESRLPQADENQQIARLIAELGNSRFDVRQRAQRELSRMGAAAFDALSAAEDSDDVEIATQARYLVRLIRIDWTQESDPADVKAVLRKYDAEPDRLAKLRVLSILPGGAGIPALCRLARFEPSHKLSKHAAALVMRSPPANGYEWPKRAQKILDTLDRSTRPAANWLRVYVQAHDDPAGALEQWKTLAAAEQETLEHHPQLSQNSLLQDLLKQEVDAFDRLGRGGESTETIERIVALERGESDSLADLVKWLSERKDWKAVDLVATKFDGSFSNEPDLLYTLAQARLVAGDPKAAHETAAKALKLNPDKPLEHWYLAVRLELKGLIDWSDGEYRYLIGLGWGNGAYEPGLLARFRLAEHLHDRLDNKEAGDVLEQAVKQMDTDIKVLRCAQNHNRTAESVRARMYFFFAEDYRLRGDNAKAIELVEKAASEEPQDVDVLIAMYRLPLGAERHKKVLENIRAVVDQTRREIQQRPDEPTPYNQLAWLVANTEGDIDEAIRLSQKSIELQHEGSYVDTLAHCYFAKRDYANAVKCQTEAAELTPGNAAIQRQLKVFQAALDKQLAAERSKAPKPASNGQSPQ